MDMIESFFQADVDEITGEPNFESQSNKTLFEKFRYLKSSSKLQPNHRWKS